MLRGIKVLDLSRLYPGPLATWLLADLGAEVIKVEDPIQGDYFREMGPELDGMSTYFRSINGGKKSIVLNLKNDEDRRHFYAMAKQSHIVVESFRPGVASKLKIGYEDLSSLNPALIYCAISGFGQTGPLKNRPAHDLNLVALSGILHLMGARNTPPLMPPIQLADVSSAYYAVIGILASLFQQQRTGKGNFVDVSMLDSLFNWLAIHLSSEERLDRGDLELSGRLVCYNIYETQDGRYISFAPLEPKFWANFCKAVNREDLLPHHMSPAVPGNPTYEAVVAIFRSKTMSEWQEFMKLHDVCWDPILTPDEALEQEQIANRRLVQQRGKGFTELSFPVAFSGLDTKPRTPAPSQGEHQREVFESFGLSAPLK